MGHRPRKLTPRPDLPRPGAGAALPTPTRGRASCAPARGEQVPSSGLSTLARPQCGMPPASVATGTCTLVAGYGAAQRPVLEPTYRCRRLRSAVGSVVPHRALADPGYPG